MKTTPLEIRQMTFRKSFRGYPPIEVEAFLESIADEFEALLHENVALKDRLDGQEQTISELKKTEGALTDTLVMAQKAIENVRVAAQKEGELVVRQAEIHAERITGEAIKEVSHLQGELINLRKQKSLFIMQIRSLMQNLEKTLLWESEIEEEKEKEKEKEFSETESKGEIYLE